LPQRVEIMRSRKRVLLVEDFEDSRIGLTKLLEAEGYEVIEAVDGAQAVEIAFKSKPDIILMDLSLPVVDGLDATRTIKQNEATKSVPIILLSAHSQEEVRPVAEAAGCADFVTKPVEFSVLASAISKHLEE
jgi:two-component system, cell cycle response regulator DivK